MPYQVAVDAYHGPLDLLLYLVRKHEVDVLDVPLAAVADQFLEAVRVPGAVDVESAGDFLVTAATLMEIKSRSLLPAAVGPAADADRESDPRQDLVRQLLEYRKFKDAAAGLDRRAGAAAARLPRVTEPDPRPAAGPAVRAVELWDLVTAFARLMRETHAAGPDVLAADDTPQATYENQIRAAVAAGPAAFRAVFTPPFSRPRLIGLFLAVLELMKAGELAADPTPEGDIRLTRRGGG